MSILHGKKVLLVEDEAIIAFAMEDMLAELGCEVVGPAMRLDEAIDLAGQNTIDAAILDVNLNNSRSYPVAQLLQQRGIPFVFATGYDREGLEWADAQAQLLSKPYRKEQVEAALSRMFS